MEYYLYIFFLVGLITLLICVLNLIFQKTANFVRKKFNKDTK